MSRGFKFRFDQMQENDPTKGRQSGNENEEAQYPSASNTRNVCLELLNGDRIFLNYAYLISGEFSMDNSSIVLTFTTHSVELKGTSLEPLFDLLMDHVPRFIGVTDERYASLETDNEFSITEITVTKM